MEAQTKGVIPILPFRPRHPPPLLPWAPLLTLIGRGGKKRASPATSKTVGVASAVMGKGDDIGGSFSFLLIPG